MHLCNEASLALMAGRVRIKLAGKHNSPYNANYEEYARPGASIGVRGRKGKASLGCYVKDRDDGCEILPTGTTVTQPSDEDLGYLIEGKKLFIEQLTDVIGKLEGSQFLERESARLKNRRMT